MLQNRRGLRSRFPRTFTLPALILAGLGGGCVPSLPSDNDVVDVAFIGAHDLGNRLIVEGTALSPSKFTDVATSLDVTDCYAVNADPLVWEAAGGSFTVLNPGPAALVLDGRDCTVNGGAFTAENDTLTVEAVDAAEVYTSIQWLEDVAQDPGLTFATAVPEGLVPLDGEPVRLAEGATMLLTPEVRRVSDDLVVGWHDGSLGTQVDGTGVEVSVYNQKDGDASDIQITVAGNADAVVQMSLEGSGTWPFTQVVADSGPFTLEAVHAAVLLSDDGTGEPLGARAVVKNGAGEIVFGAEVTWAAVGLATTPGVENGLPSSDYVSFANGCEAPELVGSEAHATVTASLDGTSVSTELVWTPADPWQAPVSCEADTGQPDVEIDCGCSSGGVGGTIGGAGLLLVLAGMQRRRG